jgi:hypothetical protein
MAGYWPTRTIGGEGEGKNLRRLASMALVRSLTLPEHLLYRYGHVERCEPGLSPNNEFHDVTVVANEARLRRVFHARLSVVFDHTGYPVKRSYSHQGRVIR